MRGRARGGAPLGVELLRKLRGGRDLKLGTYKTSVLIITFCAYASYHASRKPTSIVKSVLDPETDKKNGGLSWPFNLFPAKAGNGNGFVSENDGWAPFNARDGTAKLGEIDLAFLSMYSLGMYFAGHVGDRVDLRVFLTLGMVGSGLFVGLFGMGYWWNVHNFWFYLIMQMIAGLFQATGWPSVVAVVGNWFGKRKRGLIMGIWNAHTSVGNIAGSLIASGVLQFGWGWSFILPGALIAFVGFMVFLFLVSDPQNIGFESPYESENSSKARDLEASSVIGNGECREGLLNGKGEESSSAVGFIEAWLIPGVAPFAFCLFFAKLVAYTFLYWLPFYISHTAIGGVYLSDKSSGNLSTLFDLGGVVGGILAGHISDRLEARAITTVTFMYCAIPAMILYRVYGGVSMAMNIILMMVAGMCVNGPYALITTAVSADLGTHSSLKCNSRALATVTAIIDGTGSVGAALGPLLTGFISTKGWNGVFLMLIVASLISGLMLTHLVIAEIRRKVQKAKERSSQAHVPGNDSALLT
eukprot:TRINITY_DN6557_c0_g1_i2.p1 TRINITY_DN6557_c0_g1~~TRINITY_DN6557_c0_g1_i2.p1  ORF type:complete len:528 (-),score=32.26 TRINITY_DN6557_c0_g1_i2:609-2192(-)